MADRLYQSTSSFQTAADRHWLTEWISRYTPATFSSRSFTGSLGESKYLLRAGVPGAPTLLFLSGWLTHPLVYQMGGDLDRYPTDWHLVLAEIPGQPGLGTLQAPTSKGFITWLGELIPRLSGGPVYLIGQSYGAVPLLNFAGTAMPSEVRQLFLLAPAGVVGLRKSFRAAFFAGLNRLLSSRRSMDWVMRYININPFHCLTGEAYQAMLELMYFTHTRFSCASDVPQPVPDADLAAITVPVGLMLAENDLVFDPERTAQRMRRQLPRPPVVHLVPERGHALEVVPEVHDYLIERIKSDSEQSRNVS